MLNLRKFLFFKLQRLIGSRVESYYNEFLELEKGSLSDLQSIQNERLGRLLQHAVTEIPYYSARVARRTNPALSDFPILTKTDIKAHFFDLMTDPLRAEYKPPDNRRMGYSWVEVKSGGTTGTPTTVIHDKEFRDRGRASRLYSQDLCGFPLGVPYFRLWGSMKEINQMKDSLSHSVMSILNNESLLNAFRMEDRDIEKYLDLMNKSGRQHLMAYVDAAYQMARYSQRTGVQPKPLKSIMACAGTVTEEIRTTLEDVFQAKVYNKYGSRECADMACECESGGIHIYSTNAFIEIVDAEGKPVPSGKNGRLLITLLSNYSFPLIRYEIGDMGALKAGLCECGSPFPLMDRLEGRSVEFLLTQAGGYVSPVYIRHLVGVVHNPGIINRFQIVQESLDDYELKIELEQNVSVTLYQKVIAGIVRDLKAVFGEQCNIRIEKVSTIPATESGKFLYTVNKVKNN